MHIYKTLDMSTCHVKEKTFKLLEENRIDEIVYYAKMENGGDYLRKLCWGFFIHVPQDDVDFESLEGEIPVDLYNCIKFAREQGCWWIDLDGDGEKVEELPEYDW